MLGKLSSQKSLTSLKQMKITKENLVADFNIAENQLYYRRSLEILLQNEASDSIFLEEDKALLNEFRNNFAWKEYYSVLYSWDFGTYGIDEIECSSRKEMMNHLSPENKPEPPETFDDIFFGDAPTGKYIVEPDVIIDNLCLKKDLAKE